ncbi:Syntaxin pep12 [Schizosaccharomyces pombe]|uniref:Syntaxin pep12 n=1 Tax=Schizosaccharomyces pombe (strain 972 / ATCC 24843) TaxID=284812 RepID=PEP12_SCHPO|nr:SNARE Pep12 [Schizosaccharomyces pombe]O94651.2 RecName: Full=Syntaxin pep12 [Schizosaccharomyces pombe 972h-]CAB39138.2 SNARE Pep12 [Schizosaccharomyces pombe]|eukprot:NP_595100.2 SNARE Pep12 [Schizosaccharomyces pombe]
MSFVDLEQGRHKIEQNGDFPALASSIAQEIHALRGNTAAIHRYLVNNLTKNLHEVLEQSRELSQKVRSDLVRLANIKDTKYGEEASSFALSKLTRDFNTVLAELQRVQQKCAQQESDSVAAAQAALNQDVGQHFIEEEERNVSLSNNSSGQRQPLTESKISNSQLEYQQRLINERQGEIENLTQGINELNEIFRDLSTIINEQGELVTNIEYNVGNTSTNTKNASRQLQIANEHSRKARKRSFCFLVILVVILGVILTALIMG